MNTRASLQCNSNPLNIIDLDFITPQPNQDSELLELLHFIPGLKEILMLRQVHALEHATVWLLSQPRASRLPFPSSNFQVDNESLGGLSTEQGFFLYGDVNISDLRRAVTNGLQRLKNGEWDLAVHPRCGTNVSAEMLLTAGLALGMHFIMPRGIIEQLVGLGIAATTAAELAPNVGALAQRYLTTSVPFNLSIESITITRDMWGREAHFVKVQWQ
ncbi:hypothetical protein NIES4071_94220 [Calothrix sp. NIES-4071]|nr:hypothetical protein NIES4071_94220 [Calothrix sp. NIES-4071]BAZ63687.1 hypothetical protein NIES4105_94150 [Calothrix sp. NIES-4105]